VQKAVVVQEKMEGEFKFNFGGEEGEGEQGGAGSGFASLFGNDSSEAAAGVGGEEEAGMRPAQLFTVTNLLRPDLIALWREHNLANECIDEKEAAASTVGLVGEFIKLDEGVGVWKATVRDVRHFAYADSEEEMEERSVEISDDFLAHLRTSDVVPGLYEGGMKLWEGAVDLLHFFAQQPSPFGGASWRETMEGKRVLEIGCGQGLPGILLHSFGAKLTLQDYNYEVLPVTAMNVWMTTASEEVEYYSGDWTKVKDDMLRRDPAMRFDVIVAAETIYNAASIRKQCELFSSLIADGGVVVVAAKKYYFGVGGGTEALINSSSHFGLSLLSRHEIRDGVSNVREVIVLSKNEQR